MVLVAEPHGLAAFASKLSLARSWHSGGGVGSAGVVGAAVHMNESAWRCVSTLVRVTTPGYRPPPSLCHSFPSSLSFFGSLSYQPRRDSVDWMPAWQTDRPAKITLLSLPSALCLTHLFLWLKHEGWTPERFWPGSGPDLLHSPSRLSCLGALCSFLFSSVFCARQVLCQSQMACKWSGTVCLMLIVSNTKMATLSGPCKLHHWCLTEVPFTGVFVHLRST